jgi:hypothetical protein
MSYNLLLLFNCGCFRIASFVIKKKKTIYKATHIELSKKIFHLQLNKIINHFLFIIGHKYLVLISGSAVSL